MRLSGAMDASDLDNLTEVEDYKLQSYSFEAYRFLLEGFLIKFNINNKYLTECICISLKT